MYKAIITIQLGLAIGLVSSREATAQETTGSVALIDAFKFSPKATQAHSHMRTAIEEALARDGWTVVQGPASSDCGTTNECLAKVARESGVGYVLRVAGQRRRESDYGYDVSVDLYSPVTRQVREGNWSCGLCDSKGVGELAGKNAIDMLAKTAKEEAEIKQAASGIAPPRAAAPTPIEPAPPALVTPPKSPEEPSRISWIPWTMIGVGVVGMAYGGWALSKNGDTKGSSYPPSPSSYAHDTYSSKTLGITSMVGGGVFVVLGTIWAITTRSQTTAVSASPNHVALTVRF